VGQGQSLLLTCAAKRRRFQWVQAPPGNRFSRNQPGRLLQCETLFVARKRPVSRADQCPQCEVDRTQR
jgi:hypothetical protein